MFTFLLLITTLTIWDSYEIPNMEEGIDNVGAGTKLLTLDANSGYWQAGIVEEDRDEFPLTPHHALFCTTCQPFELRNALGTLNLARNILLPSLEGNLILRTYTTST